MKYFLFLFYFILKNLLLLINYIYINIYYKLHIKLRKNNKKLFLIWYYIKPNYYDMVIL